MPTKDSASQVHLDSSSPHHLHAFLDFCRTPEYPLPASLHLPHLPVTFFNTYFVVLGNGKGKKKTREMRCSDYEDLYVTTWTLP